MTATLKKTWNEYFCDSLVEELVRLGVKRFYVAPGSRSTPLVQAIDRNPRAKATVHLDERGLAFLALGDTKASGEPTALVTTSGSAVGHLLPAVIEASLSHLPLVLLTADRPAELLNTGANQAIDQKNIFSSFVRDFVDLPAPAASDPIQSVLSAVDESLARATGENPGPVHFNCPFREPLYVAPVSPESDKLRVDIETTAAYRAWLEDTRPWTRISPRSLTTDVESAEWTTAVETLSRARRGLIYFGSHGELDPGIFGKLRWPAFADIHVQKGLTSHAPVFRHAELLVDLAPELSPDVILYFGGPPTSKSGIDFLRRFSGQLIQVHAYPERSDPFHRPKAVITMSTGDFVEALPPISGAGVDLAPFAKIEAKLHHYFETAPALAVTEPFLAYSVSRHLKGDLYLGSSRPIRDFERYAVSSRSIGRVFSNRGASGIDGNLATAAGCAGAASGDRPLTVVLGDLAALHDLNSLALLARSERKVRLIVVNNDGGGIFSFLPVANANPSFEKFWGTPHGLNFEKFAAGFGIPYAAVRSQGELLDALAEPARLEIIEVFTDRQTNLDEHARIFAFLSKEMTA